VPDRGNVAEHGGKPAETLRVDIDRLDRLMHLAGQLAIGTARVTQIGDRLKSAVAEDNSRESSPCGYRTE